MKNILIYSFNHLEKEFWFQYIDRSFANVTLIKSDSMIQYQPKGFNYDVTIIDTYFSKRHSKKLDVIALANEVFSIPGLGTKFLLSPIEVNNHFIDLKVSRFNTDIVNKLAEFSVLIKSA